MRILLILVFAPLLSFSQHLVTPSARWTSQLWDARWITGDARAGVYLFRKTFDLPRKPAGFIIHVSADNRYRLVVNGKYINDGPQMSDLRHWRFESLDIADLLHQGHNTIAIQVWNLGDAAPVYEMGKRLALIVQGEDVTAKAVNTDKSWKIARNPAVTPIPFGPGNPELFNQYYAAGPMDRIDGSMYPWGWEQPGFDDTSWTNPQELEK
ncbi:MAG: alpha-L-rhamnosidase N-terminal domain-containing protein, partial [Bacteroidetes bacterium]|nr:alpha-L-rhamnosidase N-terminal domain-containing protein [Bacteroidota bacterium]